MLLWRYNKSTKTVILITSVWTEVVLVGFSPSMGPFPLSPFRNHIQVRRNNTLLLMSR